MPKLIIDASIAINWIHELEDLRILDELIELGYQIVLPEKVEEEISGIEGIGREMIRKCEVKSCQTATYEAISARYFRLGSGEKAVISLGREYDSEGVEYSCVVDDARARDACETESLDYTGQIGLLNVLIEAGSLSYNEGTDFLQRLEREGAWLPPDWEDLLHCTE